MVSGTREFEKKKKCGDSHRHLRAVRAHARALPGDRGASGGKFRLERESEEAYVFSMDFNRHRVVETTAFRTSRTTAFEKLEEFEKE